MYSSSPLRRDLDQDNRDDKHCALGNTGGWHPALKIDFSPLPELKNLCMVRLVWSLQKRVKCNKWGQRQKAIDHLSVRLKSSLFHFYHDDDGSGDVFGVSRGCLGLIDRESAQFT